MSYLTDFRRKQLIRHVYRMSEYAQAKEKAYVALSKRSLDEGLDILLELSDVLFEQLMEAEQDLNELLGITEGNTK